MNKKINKILIIGCGFFGSRIGLKLANKNYNVIGVKRSISNIPSEITAISCDIVNNNLKILPLEVDYIIYCPTPDSYNLNEYNNTYVIGLKNILNNITIRKKFIFISSTSVYGQLNGEMVNESSTTKPNSFSGKSILQAENTLSKYIDNYLVARFSGIYGRYKNFTIDKVTKNNIKEIKAYTNRIHIDDCVGSILHLMFLDNLKHKIFICSDSKPVLNIELYEFLAKKLGVDLIYNESDKPLRGNKRCSNIRLLDSGYKFKYEDYISGYSQYFN